MQTTALVRCGTISRTPFHTTLLSCYLYRYGPFILVLIRHLPVTYFVIGEAPFFLEVINASLNRSLWLLPASHLVPFKLRPSTILGSGKPIEKGFVLFAFFSIPTWAVPSSPMPPATSPGMLHDALGSLVAVLAIMQIYIHNGHRCPAIWHRNLSDEDDEGSDFHRCFPSGTELEVGKNIMGKSPLVRAM